MGGGKGLWGVRALTTTTRGGEGEEDTGGLCVGFGGLTSWPMERAVLSPSSTFASLSHMVWGWMYGVREEESVCVGVLGDMHVPHARVTTTNQRTNEHDSKQRTHART